MRKTKRNTIVDGIKGIAVLIVIVHHFALTFYPGVMNGVSALSHTKGGVELIIYRTPLGILVSGSFAVSLFFLITGYILTKKVKEHSTDQGYIGRVIYNRIFRLIPLIIPVLIFGYICMTFHLTFNTQVGKYTNSNWFTSFFPPGKVSLGMILGDLITRIPFGPGAPYYNVLWMIPIELFGSWFTYAFVSIFQRSKVKIYMYGILFVALMQTNYIPFLLGILVADYEENIKINNVFIFICFSVSLLVGSTTISALHIEELAPYGSLFKGVAAMLFFVSITKSRLLQIGVNQKLFVYFGQFSFHYYLTHILSLMTIASYVFMVSIPTTRFYQATALSLIAYFLGTVLFAETLKKIETYFHLIPNYFHKFS
jgi:peptidoglycan/LPS O-acetylase OafA/YrhL